MEASMSGGSDNEPDRFAIRPVSLPEDVGQLTKLDTSYATDTVYAVEISSSSVALVEKPQRYEWRYPLDLRELSRLSEFHHCSVAEWKSESRSVIVGLAAAEYVRWNRRVTLHHLYVAPDFRNRGIGVAMLNDVLAYTRTTPARCLWVETQNTNYPAIQFYKHLGFTLCGLDNSLYDDPSGATHQTALFYSIPLKE
jgi:ribosomal protein S18 acetylase RimI-like enzyme